MITIINKNGFEMIEDKSGLNFLTTPKDIDMDLYSKKPFVTFDAFRELPITQVKNSAGVLTDIIELDKKPCNYSSKNSMNSLELFDSAYYVLAALPLRGIIEPIHYNSIEHILYEGSLVLTNPFNAKLLNGKDEICNKIVYLFAELKGNLTFNEFIINEADPDNSIMRAHILMSDTNMLVQYKSTDIIVPYSGQPSFKANKKRKLFFITRERD